MREKGDRLTLTSRGEEKAEHLKNSAMWKEENSFLAVGKEGRDSKTFDPEKKKGRYFLQYAEKGTRGGVQG